MVFFQSKCDGIHMDGSFELREESGICFDGCTLFSDIQRGVVLIYTLFYDIPQCLRSESLQLRRNSISLASSVVFLCQKCGGEMHNNQLSHIQDNLKQALILLLNLMDLFI